MSERDAAREILRELLHEALANGNGHHGAAAPPAPAVPAPPVAAVLRPSTWSEPPAAGEVIGGGAPAPAPAPARDATTELVALDSDEDLERFVRALLARWEDPGQRAAIRDGRLRFALRRAGGGGAAGATGAAGRAGTAGPAAAGTLRVDRGAVTERKVEEAAKAGARLVLGPRAVLTPLAREKARASRVQIERER